MNEEKKLNMPQSLLLLLLIIGSVAVCIRLKTGGPMIGLFLSWIIIYLFCKVLKINYDQIVGGAYDAIRVVVPTLCLLMSIGVMIGTWLQSGTIASTERAAFYIENVDGLRSFQPQPGSGNLQKDRKPLGVFTVAQDGIAGEFSPEVLRFRAQMYLGIL